MFLLDGPRLPPARASVKIDLKLFERVERRMIMSIYRVSRARALEILTERAAEKAAAKAANEAEKVACEAERAAAREAFRRRITERKKLRANCG